MKRFIVVPCAFAAFVGGYGATADAGYKAPDPDNIVILASDNMQAAFGPTRKSSDNTQKAGCILYGDTTGVSTLCYAYDSTGAALTCLTNDPVSVAGAKGLDAHSFLAFTESANVCINIVTFNASEFSPKGP